jgi:hypothetical protein
MGPGAERDQTRESGAGYARQYPSEREKRIGQERCEICWKVREECDWSEVHFSREGKWVAFCNEVMWVMYKERYKTDESQGSGCVTWTIGCRLEEGEDKERSVTEGLMYVKRHAVTYEEQVLAEPCEVQREEEAVKQVA